MKFLLLYILSDYKMTVNPKYNTVRKRTKVVCEHFSEAHPSAGNEHWAQSWHVSSEKDFTFLDIHGQERHTETSTDG